MKNLFMKACFGLLIMAGLPFLLVGFPQIFHPHNQLISTAQAAENREIPAKGMVTMVDLGAKKCVPCKMMMPVMEKIEKAYQGKAIIHFFDVWEDREPAMRFGIRAIPTQIFFDKNAKEIYRHEGFMSEEAITAQLAKMGVK